MLKPGSMGQFYKSLRRWDEDSRLWPLYQLVMILGMVVLAFCVTLLLTAVFDLFSFLDPVEKKTSTGESITVDEGWKTEAIAVFFTAVLACLMATFAIDTAKDREMNVQHYNRQADAFSEYVKVSLWYMSNLRRTAQLRAYLERYRPNGTPDPNQPKPPKWGRVSQLSYDEANDLYNRLWDHMVEHPLDAAGAGIHAHFRTKFGKKVKRLGDDVDALMLNTPKTPDADYDAAVKRINEEAAALNRRYEKLLKGLRQEIVFTRTRKRLPPP